MKKLKQTRTICFANNKGGSGKSTTCSNVGYALSSLGKRVLMIDGDMQMNLSLSFFDENQVMEFDQGRNNLYCGIQEDGELEKIIQHTQYEGVDLIPASTKMSTMEAKFSQIKSKEFVLAKSLEMIKKSGNYDYILIDSPPTLGNWVMAVLVASDYLVVPIEASPWGLFGLANMLDFFHNAQEFNSNLKLMGIAITKVDTRKNYYKQTVEFLDELQDVNVFKSCIRIDSAIEWAQDQSMPVVHYKKSSRSAKEYMELAKEMDEYGSRKR